MDNELQKNADRFMGFADVYESARPHCPLYITGIASTYLERKPDTIVDLGCGTGLSTFIWKGIGSRIVGVEPSPDMLAVAREKAEKDGEIRFIQAFSNNTKLPDGFADVVTCSQSFHWMEPQSTLKEADRLLKRGGIFMTCDCDWPPVINRRAEMAYQELFQHVHVIEDTHPDIRDTYTRWDKDGHLGNIRDCGRFQYVREIVFSHTEKCNAERFILLAKSQGGLQTILKKHPDMIEAQIARFESEVRDAFRGAVRDIDFCYRVRIGLK